MTEQEAMGACDAPLLELQIQIAGIWYDRKKLRATMNALIHIKQCADGGTSSVSNQGQALDGYSELANYRDVIEKFMKEQE